MKYTQEDLGLIDKHVAQGEKNVQQQRQIVKGLRKGGYPTDESLEILAALEVTLQALRQRRTRIRTEISGKDPSRTLDNRVLAIGRSQVGLGRG